jgi:hypothetical protein
VDFQPGPSFTPFGVFDLGFTASMWFSPMLSIPEAGLLALNLFIPIESSLVGETLYFQALLYHEPEFLISSPDNIPIIQ